MNLNTTDTLAVPEPYASVVLAHLARIRELEALLREARTYVDDVPLHAAVGGCCLPHRIDAALTPDTPDKPNPFDMSWEAMYEESLDKRRSDRVWLWQLQGYLVGRGRSQRSVAAKLLAYLTETTCDAVP